MYFLVSGLVFSSSSRVKLMGIARLCLIGRHAFGMPYIFHQVVSGPKRAPQSLRVAFARRVAIGAIRHSPNVRNAETQSSNPYIAHAIQKGFHLINCDHE